MSILGSVLAGGQFLVLGLEQIPILVLVLVLFPCKI